MCLNDVIFNARIAELETKVDNYVKLHSIAETAMKNGNSNSMQFLPLYNSKTITLPIGVQSSYYSQLSIRFMSEEQYNEFLKAYTKEALANMIKADIRSRFPEPYASMYCQQFDNFKNVADFFEFAVKLMRR